MINYSRANLLDIFSLERLEKECFVTEAFNRRLIKNLLSSPKTHVFKATTPSGRIVGNIIGVIHNVGDQTIGRIFSLGVSKEFRKKGIAFRLVKLLEEEFCLRGIKQIQLEVYAFNITAQSFYKRCGYGMTNHVLFNFYHDGSDAYVMVKDLRISP